MSNAYITNTPPAPSKCTCCNLDANSLVPHIATGTFIYDYGEVTICLNCVKELAKDYGNMVSADDLSASSEALDSAENTIKELSYRNSRLMEVLRAQFDVDPSSADRLSSDSDDSGASSSSEDASEDPLRNDGIFSKK